MVFRRKAWYLNHASNIFVDWLVEWMTNWLTNYLNEYCSRNSNVQLRGSPNDVYNCNWATFLNPCAGLKFKKCLLYTNYMIWLCGRGNISVTCEHRWATIGSMQTGMSQSSTEKARPSLIFLKCKARCVRTDTTWVSGLWLQSVPSKQKDAHLVREMPHARRICS